MALSETVPGPATDRTEPACPSVTELVAVPTVSTSEAASVCKVTVLAAAFETETRAMLDEHLDELERLVETAGGVVVGRVAQELRSITPATLSA